MKHVERVLTGVESVVKAFSLGAGLATVSLFIFILVVIASRFMVFQVEGQIEICNLFLAALGSLALGYALFDGAHVRVDVLPSHLSPRWQVILESFLLLSATGFFLILTWSTGQAAHTYWERTVFTEGTINLPKWISSFLVSFGCLLIAFALLVQFFRCITGVTGSKK